METPPLITERMYNAPIERVWKAITDKEQMKQWYFDIEEFRPEKGFKFEFTVSEKHKDFIHDCEVLAAEAPHKLSYSWTYRGHPGYTVVTFELFEEEKTKTRLRLTHEGLGSFPQDDPDFAASCFEQGWNRILGTSLKNFVETKELSESR